MSDGYTPDLALKVCELIAGGETVGSIAKTNGLPSKPTIYRWLSQHPKFFDAYERARELSAQSFDDEALDMARELRGANDFTGTKVQAYNIAMGQLRWSASRRDKGRYGQQVQATTAVPIQINTTLNLGQEGMGPATDTAQSIYTVEAHVLAPEEELPTANDQPFRLAASQTTEGEPSAAAEPAEAVDPFDDLEDTNTLAEPRKKPLPKRHKSAAATARSAIAYAKRTK